MVRYKEIKKRQIQMNFEKIGETNCRIDDIQNQDKILIGGSFYGKMDLAVTADLEQFEDFFQKVEINAQKVQENEAMKNWINQVAPNLDSTLFAHMWAFDNTLRKMYPNLSTNIDKRQNYYDEEGTKKLSQSVSDGVCMCAEISILAQAYFQKQNIPTKISGGELLHSQDEEFGEAHYYISLQDKKGEDYIYDPANPLLYSNTYLPRISTLEVTPAQKKQFENKIHSQGKGRACAFMEAKDVITKTSWYYGFGDGANIFPSFLFSKNNKSSVQSSENSL